TRRSTGTGNMEGWLETANNNLRQLLALTDALHAYPVPAAEGNYEALVEFDRRRVLKEQLVYTAISTCLDTTMAVGALSGAKLSALGEEGPHLAAWGPSAIRLERALFRADVAA